MSHGQLVKGTMIKFRNGDEILTGWIESNIPVYDEHENIIGYMVSCPEFQGAVDARNIIKEDE